MRILVHDYAGHPFQVELSRSLARRGHDVRHVFSASNTTPQGGLKRRDGDPDTFDSVGIQLPKMIDKNSLLKRRLQEGEHGKRVIQQISEFRPEVVISANTPLDAQSQMLKYCHAHGIRFVYWLQDLIGIATYRILSEKLALPGRIIGNYYIRLERSLLQKSDAIVSITEDFREVLEGLQVRKDHIHVIENWAPLSEVPLFSKKNAWSIEHGLAENICLIYSGTLGMKHNPELLLELARSFRDQQNIKVVVISEGRKIDWLQEQQREEGLNNLLLLPFQPFSAVPQVLATADVLMAILEESAGIYSVPSKVLTNLCIGRPLLLSVPLENLSARIVAGNCAGLVISPNDVDGFVKAAKRLVEDDKLRQEMGRNARSYAENHFDIEKITDRFETVLSH